MTQRTNPHSDRVTPQSLAMLASVTGIGAIIRDEDLKARWCDEAYAALNGLPAERIIGTTLDDLLPAPAARERASFLREVLESGTPRSLVQFGNDKRLVCRILPIDEHAFGYRGVLCLIAEGPLIDTNTDEHGGAALMRTPYLHDFAVLTKAELRTIYDIACGRANQDIADRQYRSVRTIENHVESIHKKLGTATRSALVRLATERGVQGFTAEQWDEIVEGSTETRKAGAPLKKQALMAAAANEQRAPKPGSLN